MPGLTLNIQKHLNDIKTEGLACLFRKFRKAVFLFITTIFALPVVGVVILLKPLKIRLGELRSERIGHYAYETDRYLCQCAAGLHDGYFDIFFNANSVCNRQLQKMIKANLHVLRIPKIGLLMRRVCALLKRFPKCAEHVFTISSNRVTDPGWSLARSKCHFFFSKEEKMFGTEALQKMGIPQGAQYICIYGRDSAYLNRNFPERDWTYHDYRDDDINTYLPAAEALTRRGYYIIRMGHIVKEPLQTKNSMIIDYSAKGYRTDFLDMYLPAHCRFFLGNPSGLIVIPATFRRPIVLVNFSQGNGFYNWDINTDNAISIWKRVWVHKEQRFLAFREMIDLFLPGNCGRKDLPKIADLGEMEIVDNTANEIKDLALEMDDRTNGAWKMSEENALLQERFKKVYYEIRDDLKFTSVGEKFLRDNADLLTNHRLARTRTDQKLEIIV